MEIISIILGIPALVLLIAGAVWNNNNNNDKQ